jgi:hypothetical protein
MPFWVEACRNSRSTSLQGAPGAGKTTLVQQIMFTLARPDRPALYFTVLGEPPLKMLRYQQQFEFFNIAEVNASVRFVNLAKEALEGGLGEVLRRIVRKWRPRRPRSWWSTHFDRSSKPRNGRMEGPTCRTSSRTWACG